MTGRLATLALAALLSAAGCGVLEELDKGKAEMDKRSPSARKEQEAKAAAAAQGASSGAAAQAANAAGKARQAAATWWQNARSLGSEETSEDVVHCIVGGSDAYMRRHDCLMRGGRVATRSP